MLRCTSCTLAARSSAAIHPQVTFQLHQSFKNPVREVFEPPYEVTEAGWGEFDVGVHVRAQQGFPRPLRCFRCGVVGLSRFGSGPGCLA